MAFIVKTQHLPGAVDKEGRPAIGGYIENRASSKAAAKRIAEATHAMAFPKGSKVRTTVQDDETGEIVSTVEGVC
jgi:hypothetical protein